MKNTEEHEMMDHGYKAEDLMVPELKEQRRPNILRDLNSIIMFLSFEEFKVVYFNLNIILHFNLFTFLLSIS